MEWSTDWNFDDCMALDMHSQCFHFTSNLNLCIIFVVNLEVTKSINTCTAIMCIYIH